MLADFRYAFRSLVRNRKFAAVTVLTLAAGIGAAAAIFSVTDWILFRATKFPEDVYLIGGRNDQNPSMQIRFDFAARAYLDQTSVMSSFAKAAHLTGNVVLDGQPVGTSWLGISPNLFPMLGIVPQIGRGFLPGEDVEGADHVVILSHDFWVRQLGGRADALGHQLRLGDAVCTVVGVLREAQNLPPYFYGEIFRPLAYHVDPAAPWIPSLYLLGQLRPGVTRESATQALGEAKLDIPVPLRPFNTNDHAVLSSMGEISQSMHLEIYSVLLGAVGFLYAIACLNASNLMLVRMLGQRRELCIRLALGGGRWRIIRLLAAECVLLAIGASLFGLLIANWLFPLLLRVAGSSSVMTDALAWGLNWRMVGALALLTVSTSVLIVLIPGFRVLRTDLHAGLKDGGTTLGESPALARLRGGFVILQAAFAVILLSGAGLMIQTFHRLQQVDLGFDPRGKAKVQISFPPRYSIESKVRLAKLWEIQVELQNLPGVRAVGFGNDILLPGGYFPFQNVENPSGKPLSVAIFGFNVGFQEAAGLTLKRGRWLTETIGNDILVNESFARARWPNQDPIGQFVRPLDTKAPVGQEAPGWKVAGVVGDVHETTRGTPGLYVYHPEGWAPANFNTYVLQFSSEFKDTFAGLIRRKLYSYDPALIVSQILPLSRVRDQQLWAERLADSVLTVLAVIAIGLTVVGIFSVLAYTVDRRRSEFGVRLALGASRRDVLRLVMSRGIVLTLVGVGIGIAGALVLSRSLQHLLYETSAQDPSVLAAVGTAMLLTSVCACLLPSWRATQLDVSRLLRPE